MKNKSKLLTFLCVPFMLAACGEDVNIDNPSENNNTTGEINNGGNSGNNEQPAQPHEHTWDEGWTSDANQHWHKCTGKDNNKACKEKNGAEAHDFGDWVIDSYAKNVTTQNQWGGGSTTTKQNGSKHRDCKVCTYRETKEVTDYDLSIYKNPTTKYANKFDRDYHIFDQAPEIRFTTNAGTDFATKPNKSKGGGDPWEVQGTFSTANCPDEYKIEAAEGGMKVRGNFTTDYAKKGFRLKFEDKTNLFGLNKGKKFKKWVLFADVKDNSMLRNAVAFYMAKRMAGDNVFVSDFTPVHVVINDEYWGLYLLGEQKEAKSNRIDLPEVEKNYAGTDIGYCFELDKYAKEEAKKADGDPTFEVQYKPQANNKSHSGENRYECNGDINCYTMLTDITNKNTQLPFIKKRVESVYTVLYNACYNNTLQEIVNEQVVTSSETDIETCLAKTIDIDSFVDMYLFNEIVCDPDIGYSSFYLSIDMSATGDKKLRLDNPWDFDSALGVRHDTVENSQGMYASESSNMWLSMISRCQFFKDKVKAKWNALRESNLFEKALEMIEDYSYSYSGDYKRNFDKWPSTMGNNPETNFELREEVKKFTTQKQAEAFMYNWLGKRVDYLESQFGTNRASILTDNPNSGSSTGGGTGGNTGGGTGGGTVVTPTAITLNNGYNKIEAEVGTLSGNCKVKNKTGENISGNSYVGDLNPSGGSVTFTVKSPKACQATLKVGLSARTDADHKLTDLFDITVNGTAFTSNANIPQGTGTDYHCWTSVDAGKINLNNGNNTIVFTAKATSTNFDYIEISL